MSKSTFPDYTHVFDNISRSCGQYQKAFEDADTELRAYYQPQIDFLNELIESGRVVLYDNTPIVEFTNVDEPRAVIVKSTNFKQKSKSYNIGYGLLAKVYTKYRKEYYEIPKD